MDMSGIINDMDLVLEGIPFSSDNMNIKIGLSILEHNIPNFKYSSDNLNINEKIEEIKNYYYGIGYNNNSILEVISANQKVR